MDSLSLIGVCKQFGDFTALKEVNLDVHQGELICFLGPSGCGKTTLLRMTAGLETVTEGDLLIGGKRVNDVHPRDRNIAMVFQNYAIYPHVTVADNIAFGLYRSKLSKSEKRARVEEVAQTLGLSHLLERRPSALSGGQRQRVAIGRAMAMRCCCPPDSWLGNLPPLSGSPTSASSSATRASRCAAGVRRFTNPYATFSATDRLGNSAYDWNTMP